VLVDRLGRRISRLRLAVSDQCNLQCIYCRPLPGRGAGARALVLPADELVLVAEAAVACGIEHIRLTGGEPLLREDLEEIVGRVSGLAVGLDLSLTTNGWLLAEQAGRLARAGLRRVNVSLDSLRRERFCAITGQSSPERVLAGLEAAAEVGLSPIKVNVVVIRGVNDDELVDMVRFADEHGYDIRFIEFMPLDGREEWSRDSMVPVAEMRARIEEAFGLTPAPATGSPGEEYLVGAGPTRVSLIGAVSRPFCGRCNRLRVTADGFLRTCLFSPGEHDLRPALNSVQPMEALVALFAEATAGKPAGHYIGQENFVRPARSMFAIGG
jgi:cyclic pyranopterin phosphate synthase